MSIGSTRTIDICGIEVILVNSPSPISKHHPEGQPGDLVRDNWTTGVRFHPIEHLASLAIKLVAVVLLGAPAVAVILFEVLLNASSMFNHANGRMRQSLDRFLQLFVVTPSLHRIHHSIDRAEQHTNFGFNFTLWDRLAGSLRTPEARQGAPLTQGVTELRRPIETEPIFQQLVMPFRRIAATPHTTDQRAN